MADYDPLYVAARTVLLDALEALGSQRDATIVVGAQAIYMRTGEADLPVAPYTTDADLALAPGDLADEPHLEDLLGGAEFSQEGQQPGSWVKSVPVGGRNVLYRWTSWSQKEWLHAAGGGESASHRTARWRPGRRLGLKVPSSITT